MKLLRLQQLISVGSISACLAFISISAGAQPYLNEIYPSNSDYLAIDADFQINSTAITNRFIYDFYNSRFLSNDLKEYNSNRMNGTELLGYSLDAGIHFRLSDTSNKENIFYGSIEHHDRMELSFNQELFNLYFYGNAMYADKDVDLGGSRLRMMAYQQLKTGYCQPFTTKKYTGTIGLAIGFVKGQRCMDINLNRATLFTEKDGKYISLDVDMEMYRSDTLMSDIKVFNGYGFTGDFFINFTDKHENNFLIQLSDFGFISWTARSQQYKRDTMYSFDGFSVDNLFDISGETFSGESLDSITNEFAFADQQSSFTTFTPMKLKIAYNRFIWKKRLLISASVDHLFFTSFRPQTVIKPSYCIRIKRSELRISPMAYFRGYGNISGGIELSANIANSFFLRVGSGYLSSMIFPESTSGIGGYFSLVKSLR